MKEFFAQRKPWVECIWPGDIRQIQIEMLWINWWVWAFTPAPQVYVPPTSLQGLLSTHTTHPPPPAPPQGSRKHNLKTTVKPNSFILQMGKLRPREGKCLAQRQWQYLAQVPVPFVEELANIFCKGTDDEYFQLWGHMVSTTTVVQKKSSTIYKLVGMVVFQSNSTKTSDNSYTHVYSDIIHSSQRWKQPKCP